MQPQNRNLRAAVLAALSLTLWITSPSPARAQETSAGSGVGTIEGRVQDGTTGANLRNARVQVGTDGVATSTDQSGFFRLAGVPAGEVEITASYLTRDAQVRTVTVSPGGVQRVDFELGSSGVVELERFVVLDQRELSAQALAMNQQRQSPNIKNVVAFDEYPKGSDENLADFIQFIPGVAINYSGRSGLNASVRGLPPEMTTVTVDGNEVASIFSATSRISNLLAIPTTNVATVELTKVPTPDLPASTLGGNINVTTKSGFERKTPLLKWEVSSAFDPQFGFKMTDRVGPHGSMTGPTVRPSFELSYVRPVNDNLAVTLAVSHRENYYAQEDATIQAWNQVAGFQTTVTNIRLAQLTDTWTTSLAVDWKLNDRNIFRFSSSYRSREADQGNHQLQVNYGAGATGNETMTQGAATGVGSLAQSNSWQRLLNSTLNNSLSYTHLGDVWKVDATGSFSVSRFQYVPGEETGYFGGASVNMPNLVIRGEGRTGKGDRAAHLRPATISAVDRNGNPVDTHDGNLYTINSGNVDNQGVLAQKGQVRVNAARDLPTSFPLRLQTGVSWLYDYQKGYNHGKTYNFRPGLSVTDRRAGNYDVINSEYSDAMAPMYGRKVQWVGPARLYDLYRAHPEYWVLNDVNAYQTEVNNSKKFEETISAGYIRLESRLLKNRLWLVGGVRYERTDDEGRGPRVDPTAQYRKNPDGSFVRDGSNRLVPITTDAMEVARLVYQPRGTHMKINYDDFYPSLNASYEIRDDLILRLGYAETIGRPNLQFLIPGITYSAVTESSTVQNITVINSRLRPWSGRNYDVSLESYLVKDGFGSIGFFQKDMSDFFTSESLIGTPEILAEYGITATAGDALDYVVNTRGNGGDARVRGMELTYRQSFGFVGEWARGVQAFVNYTRSSLDGSRTADFTGFSPRSLSWGITYTRPRFAVKYSSNLQYETQRAPVNASATVLPNTFNYQAELRRDNLSVEVVVRPRLMFFASLQDFNTGGGYHFRLLQYAPDANIPEFRRPTRIIEYGMSAIVGFKGEF